MRTRTIFRALRDARRKWLRVENYPREFEDPKAESERRYRQLRTFEIEFDRRMDHYDWMRTNQKILELFEDTGGGLP